MLRLFKINNSDSRLRYWMSKHYSKPNGFVGRNICYLIMFGEHSYGAIVGGSATLNLPGRDEFFGYCSLDRIINNTFFHVEKRDGSYPVRNFVPSIVGLWRKRIRFDWHNKYSDPVKGFETLVEIPRKGECYLRDGWQELGWTEGKTCKRVAGRGTDEWSGKRVWNVDEIRIKRVFARLAVIE